MKATVSVQITVTVECRNNWGDNCTIEQVKKQAREEAMHLATRSL